MPQVALSYLCTLPSDPAEAHFETFALSLLSSLLLDGPPAPLYQALIEPNIGSGYACPGGDFA